MEISVPIDEINTRNIYFGEKRKNIIVDGDFVKIVYSTDSFEMNGMYILIEFVTANHLKRPDSIYIEDQSVVKPGGVCQTVDTNGEWVKIVNKSSIITTKRNIIFNILMKENMQVIEQLCQIETDIVDRYIASNCPLKTASYVLKNQLLSGSIKYHSENYAIQSHLLKKTDSIFESKMTDECILKISGIWETATNVGITMKFILLQKYF